MNAPNTHGTPVETLRAALAAHEARVAAAHQSAWDGCYDISGTSERLDGQERNELLRKVELAADGWRMGFVGLCRLDGSTATGRWIEGRYGHAWGAPKADGSRGLDFLSQELLYASRCGDAKAVAKLRAKGYEWQSRRCRADCRYFFAEGSRGWSGVYSANLVTYPCDATGNRICCDALVYPADAFFLDGAADVVRAILAGDAEWEETCRAAMAA